jgi:hypothetical protein
MILGSLSRESERVVLLHALVLNVISRWFPSYRCFGTVILIGNSDHDLSHIEHACTTSTQFTDHIQSPDTSQDPQ